MLRQCLFMSFKRKGSKSGISIFVQLCVFSSSDFGVSVPQTPFQRFPFWVDKVFVTFSKIPFRFQYRKKVSVPRIASVGNDAKIVGVSCIKGGIGIELRQCLVQECHHFSCVDTRKQIENCRKIRHVKGLQRKICRGNKEHPIKHKISMQ